jgi:hypothetical protein
MATKPGRRRRDVQNCRRKIAYESWKDAKLAARLVRQLIHELVLPYACPLPKHWNQRHWHIGHPDLLSENDKRTRE